MFICSRNRSEERHWVLGPTVIVSELSEIGKVVDGLMMALAASQIDVAVPEDYEHGKELLSAAGVGSWKEMARNSRHLMVKSTGTGAVVLTPWRHEGRGPQVDDELIVPSDPETLAGALVQALEACR